ncbi:multiple sugar transport system permease protein [Anaerotaenia torta]|uniref:carbohydrate ABC transporter permease n=1 Tax=Anaerotaenia torta TaxID=433293 RepID=UPI003D1DE6E8
MQKVINNHKRQAAGLMLHKKRTLTKARLKYYGTCYAFSLPYFLIFCIFTVSPVLISIVLSFTNFNMLEMPKFVGVDNYIRLFLEDEIFLIALKNTFILAAVTGPVSYIMALLIAWVINELGPKLRAVVTVVFYAPSLSGNVLLIWTVLFNSDAYGYVNGWLMELGLIDEPIRWFTDKKYILPLVIVVVLWSSMGTNFLSFIAGLQGIDRSYYEAGAVDGIKNRFQELWYITLPSMRPQLLFGAVMSISSSFGIGGVITGLVGFPSTDYAAHTIINHLEDFGGIRYEMGYASAIAAVLFAMMLLSNYLVKKVITKIGE